MTSDLSVHEEAILEVKVVSFWTSIRFWVPISSQVPACPTAVECLWLLYDSKTSVVYLGGILSIISREIEIKAAFQHLKIFTWAG